MEYKVLLRHVETGELTVFAFVSEKTYKIWYDAHHRMNDGVWLQEEIL